MIQFAQEDSAVAVRVTVLEYAGSYATVMNNLWTQPQGYTGNC